ncbi:hypothetical protein H6G04_29990 [Calothrix membranacea FACHB-236]|nr:hypothetical protein [Calothrix membranacea FACHB-236]
MKDIQVKAVVKEFGVDELYYRSFLPENLKNSDKIPVEVHSAVLDKLTQSKTLPGDVEAPILVDQPVGETDLVKASAVQLSEALQINQSEVYQLQIAQNEALGYSAGVASALAYQQRFLEGTQLITDTFLDQTSQSIEAQLTEIDTQVRGIANTSAEWLGKSQAARKKNQDLLKRLKDRTSKLTQGL